ncbi:MAG: hypothetical protein JWP44_622 [Mucilaginibacter sp.]|nr:hypothetical protein [Mucilaginibacter sp.]
MKKHLLSNRNPRSFPLVWQCLLTVIFTGLLMPTALLAQATSTDSTKTQTIYSAAPVKPQYPRVVGYVSFILPLETLSGGKFTPNFSDHTSTIGFPIGVNVLYSDHFGFSYEFTPTIKASGGTSKMSNLLFDPGTMFRFDHGFTIITRLAFETSGRYGFTPVFNQVYARTKAVNYFVALSLPTRYGNSAPSSIGLNLQIGFIFN